MRRAQTQPKRAQSYKMLQLPKGARCSNSSKTFGLGLFVNGSYALLNGNFSTSAFVVTAGAFCIMLIALYYQRRQQ